jgi:hypothetical protein
LLGAGTIGNVSLAALLEVGGVEYEGEEVKQQEEESKENDADGSSK